MTPMQAVLIIINVVVQVSAKMVFLIPHLGLIWQKYGLEICQGNQDVVNAVDRGSGIND